MARLKTIGFELNDLTAGVEVTSGSGTLNTLSTTTVRSGTYAARINPSAAFRWIGQVFKSSADASETYIRGYINIASLPTGGQCEAIGIWDSALATRRAYINISTAGKLQLFDGSVQIGSDSTTLSTGTWYRVELRVIGGSGTATLDARLDGSSFASSTTASVGNFDALYFGAPNVANTFDVFWDDIAINDTSGSSQNSWPGSGKVITLEPNAAGDANTFATQTGGTAGAANNYTRVDEIAPNDATDFNGSSTLNQEDMFNADNSGIGASDTVNVVHIDLRFRNSTADATAAIKSQVKKTSGGTVAQSSAIVPNSTTWKSNGTTTGRGHTQTTYTDPDSSAWTQSTLDSMQIGYKLTTGPGTAGRRVDVTKVWATVDYTPVTNTTTTKTITGQSRITASTTKTQPGKAAVQNTTTKTQGGVSRVQKSVAQTQSAVSRITASATKTITGVANIRNTTTKTITGVARITATTTRTQAGLSRIQKSVAQTLQGLSRITANTLKTLAGLARVTATTLQTVTAVARVQATVTKTITGVANILSGSLTLADSYSQTNQDDYGFINAGSTIARGQSFTAVSGSLDSVKFYLYKNGSPTGSAYAKVWALTGTHGTNAKPSGAALAVSDAFDVSTLTAAFSLATFNFSGANRIALTNGTQYVVSITFNGGDSTNRLRVGYDSSSSTHPGNQSRSNDESSWDTTVAAFDLCFYVYVVGNTTTTKTITGASRITASATKTISGTARITASATKTQSGTSRITATTLKTITAVARITASAVKTLSGVARIQATAARTMAGVSRMQKSATQTIQGLSRVTATTTRTTTGLSRVQKSTTRTQSAVSRVQKAVQRTISAVARITNTTLRVVTGLARVTASTIRTLTGSARIQKTAAWTQSGVARIQQRIVQTVAGLSRITSSAVRTITGRTRITTTASQTQLGQSRISITTTKTQAGKSRVTQTVTQDIAGIASLVITRTQTIQGVAKIRPYTRVHPYSSKPKPFAAKPSPFSKNNKYTPKASPYGRQTPYKPF